MFPRDANKEIILEYGYGLQDTWGELEKMVDAGLTRHIGISNFCVALIHDLLTFCRIKPYCNQIEIHPNLQQDVLIKYCHDNGIYVTAYSPLGGSYGEQTNYKTWSTDPAFKAMCERHKKSLAQILLRWHTQKWPKMYSVIPKSSTLARVGENM